MSTVEPVEIRPKLSAFRVEFFQLENRSEGASLDWTLNLEQTIEVGLGAPKVSDAPYQAVVKIKFVGDAYGNSAKERTAKFHGEYMARFNYPMGYTQDEISALLMQESNQYRLVAQAFPLAISHFRREMLASGLDSKDLPMGI
jgi:hypothetical protein